MAAGLSGCQTPEEAYSLDLRPSLKDSINGAFRDLIKPKSSFVTETKWKLASLPGFKLRHMFLWWSLSGTGGPVEVGDPQPPWWSS